MLFYNVFGKKSSVLNKKKRRFNGDETKTARNGDVFKKVKQSGAADFCRTEKNRDNPKVVPVTYTERCRFN